MTATKSALSGSARLAGNCSTTRARDGRATAHSEVECGFVPNRLRRRRSGAPSKTCVTPCSSACGETLWRRKDGGRGQAQQGVDVFGSPAGDRTRYWGIQCKGKESNYASKPTWSEVPVEIAKAEKFSPELDRWIFATTAPVDAALQQAARELSVVRNAQGLFSVDVLGWEEVAALLAETPEVMEEFYPEHADCLPQVIETLRELPRLRAELSTVIEQFIERSPLSRPLGTSGIWETITFDRDRGMGPALLGYPSGPSDAVGCPRLPEADLVATQLNLAYSARISGDPGTGKSVCAYQVANALSATGYKVLRLLDLQAVSIALGPALPG